MTPPEIAGRPDPPGISGSRPETGTAPAPGPEPDGEWNELLFAEFGPRHWNVGCG